MQTGKDVGRIIGALIAIQMVGGMLANFVLWSPVISPPGFLVNAAANPLHVTWSVLIGLVAGAISVAIAITALPVFRQHSEPMAWWFLALGIVGLSLTVVESNAMMSMLSLSQAYAKANVSDPTLFEALRGVVAASRNWAHYTHLIVGGASFLVFYGVLYRFTLIPRALAAFGLIAVLLQLTAVTMPLFGQRIVMLMIMPMALAHLALAVWLLMKGFQERRPTDAESLGAGIPRQA